MAPPLLSRRSAAAAAVAAIAGRGGLLAPEFSSSLPLEVANSTAALPTGGPSVHLLQRWQHLEHTTLHELAQFRNESWAAAARQVEVKALEFGHSLLLKDAVDVEGHHDPDNDYDLFREEDLTSWIFFFCVFFVLIVFDNTVLHGKEDEALSFRLASFYTVFWLGCAAAFNAYIYVARGPDDAFNWGTGYLLEWMLSVDNLFVFRSIFLTFGTPDSQKHKPLFWGIIGAVVFRMIFFAIGEILLHTFTWMYVLLGLFLIYTGLKIMLVDEDEEISPEDDPVLKKITEHLPYVNEYAPTPLFFARLDDFKSAQGTFRRSSSGGRGSSSSEEPRPGGGYFSGEDGTMGQRSSTPLPRTQFDELQPLRATKLLLVVVCLELTDVVFAIDSVSAIVAQIPDLFLAYTACVFAMLGLRATFFVVDELVKLFSLLSYGVALILIFIGLKLCFKGYIHIPHEVVCFVLVSTLVMSLVASYIYEEYIKKGSGSEDEEAGTSKAGTDDAEKAFAVVNGTPEDSEAIAARS